MSHFYISFTSLSILADCVFISIIYAFYDLILTFYVMFRN